MPTPNSFGSVTAVGSSGNADLDTLIYENRWAGAPAVLTYSFPTSGAVSLWEANTTYGYGRPGSGEPFSGQFSALNSAQQTAVQNVLAAWSSVANIAFTAAGTESSSNVGELRFAFTDGNIQAGAFAWAYLPSQSPIAGDVWYAHDKGGKTDTTWAPTSQAYFATLHEVGHALGLLHPFEPKTVGGPTISAALNTQSYTVMSYSAKPNVSGTSFMVEDLSADAMPTTPMILDIQAMHHIYGANTTFNAGNTTYTFLGTGLYHQTIYDTGGEDTIAFSNNNNAITGLIDLRPGLGTGSQLGRKIRTVGSDEDTFVNNIWIYTTSIIENATGGAGNDTLTGNDVANRLMGAGGNDTITGNGGNDTAVYSTTAASYTLGYNNGTITVTHKNSGSDGVDTLVGVEILDFTDRDLSLVGFSALHYLAANNDLLAAFGNNQPLATQHYVTNGFHESRTTTFEGLRYTASYADLINAFGTNADIATQHFVTNGFAEGRRVSFDAFKYLASYVDLLNAFGSNTTIATQHYITNGFAEGRQLTFDGLRYIASHVDLMNAFGTNATLATQHYVTNGFAEGRQLSFDPMRYIASHTDLINAFGANTSLGAQHYITNGFSEGRQLTFDAEFYLARYADLRAAFGTNTGIATQHWVTNGFAEGRVGNNAGNDVLVGSSQADNLNAGNGTDSLTGGGGRDTLTGGSGIDTFIWLALSDTTTNPATCDIVLDFTPGTDKIDLSAIDANAATGGDDAFTVMLDSGVAFSAAGQLRLDGSMLYGSVNADATADFAIQLSGAPVLSLSTDFIA